MSEATAKSETTSQKAIPVKKIKISLKAATPTPVTPDGLKSMLDNIGMTCKFADKERLPAYISEVSDKLPESGKCKAYTILRQAEEGEVALEDVYTERYTNSSVGNFEPTMSGSGYSIELETIISKNNFAKLKEKFGDGKNKFNGVEGKSTYQERYGSIESVKSMFVEVGTNASSILVEGLDKDAIKSVLSNAISPMKDSNLPDYEKEQRRIIFLVDGYDEESGEANAIGVLAIEWTLFIKDYKEKKKASQYDTTLNITMRAVVFDSMIFMDYYNYLVNGKELPGETIEEEIPVKDKVVTIFTKLPPANRDTYEQSLPIDEDEDGADVIVLYSPDLQTVCSLNNTKSDVTSSYAKSVMTGFTFSSTQEMSATASFEAGIVFAKGSFEVGFSLSFTEEYTKQTTETISYECPPGKIAYIYQGSLLAAKLQYNGDDQTFRYLSTKAKFLTDIFTTTGEPIDGEVVIRGGKSAEINR
ncbi:hypothetical protein L579_4311 [Pantoea sp. AS-PWVM4]|uniref:hypothetical protein n=1 Tax=Pantoea sp. AS-PWVM4 TaxID=1332069 RepID=UPI0003AC6068|nr:hypothetical protein [Pantoea sp. AS-PWVM4]ERK16401.1 hypothetical protein L579_4311 [Pantoea sp. AS-PWVM4]